MGSIGNTRILTRARMPLTENAVLKTAVRMADQNPTLLSDGVFRGLTPLESQVWDALRSG